METDQILDLFSLSDTSDLPPPNPNGVNDSSAGVEDDAVDAARHDAFPLPLDLRLSLLKAFFKPDASIDSTVDRAENNVKN